MNQSTIAKQLLNAEIEKGRSKTSIINRIVGEMEKKNSNELSLILRNKDLPSFDGATFVRGEGMKPIFNGGDIILYKNLKKWNLEQLSEKPCLISIKVGNEDKHVCIKYLQSSNKGNGFITLVSENPFYQPQDILKDRIKDIAIIVGSIHPDITR